MVQQGSYVSLALSNVITHFISHYQTSNNDLPIVDYDEQWQSPCIRKVINESTASWLPIAMKESLNFENVEQALNIKIHDDLKEYFTAYFSHELKAQCPEGELTLLLPWNNDDFSRLQENLIGHVLMKRQLKQPLTLFFAVTDDDEHFLSINNETGAVWVERVGCEPHKKLANSLADFLNGIELIFD